MSFNRRSVAFAALRWASAATLLLALPVPSKALEAELFNAGALRATSTTPGSTVAVSVVNLGHCSTLCAASSTCMVFNYLASSRVCELLSATANGAIAWYSDSSSQLFIKVDLIGNLVPDTAQMQSVAGAQVQSGRAEGYTSYSLQKAINAMHCWRLCSALTGGLCRMFAHHASLLSCLVYDVDFYSTWTTASTADPGWTSYYAKQTGGWKLLYKMSKGINVDATGILFSGPTSITGSTAQMALDSTCNCYLRNDIIDSWSKFPITGVSLVLGTGGKSMKYLNFSTTATDTASTFFKASKIVASSWTDLGPTTTPMAYMDIGTPTNNFAGRYFLIASVFAGCSGDTGWITVNGQSKGGCTYDLAPVPQFAYANGSTWTTFTSSVFADALLMYVKL